MPNRARHGSPPASSRPWRHTCVLGLLVLAAAAWPFAWPAARAEPGSELQLRWPFEAGQDWLILQGYDGVSHNATDYDGIYRYSFDLVLASEEAGPLNTRTAGQPVLAAADGELMPYIDAASGCYFLRHDATTADGASYFTVYVHLEPAIDVSQPELLRVTRGQLLGTVAAAGQRGSGDLAHLHFGLLASSDPLFGVGSRTPVPFDRFISGWSFPVVTGASNQYAGEVVRQAQADLAAVGVSRQEATSTSTGTPAVPTATPAATATPVPPTATPTPRPSATPPPTATRSPSPSPTLTASASATPSPSATPALTARPRPTATPTPAASRWRLGPVVSQEHAPVSLGVAAVGLAALAWRRLTNWEN